MKHSGLNINDLSSVTNESFISTDSCEEDWDEILEILPSDISENEYYIIYYVAGYVAKSVSLFHAFLANPFCVTMNMFLPQKSNPIQNFFS